MRAQNKIQRESCYCKGLLSRKLQVQRTQEVKGGHWAHFRVAKLELEPCPLPHLHLLNRVCLLAMGLYFELFALCFYFIFWMEACMGTS